VKRKEPATKGEGERLTFALLIKGSTFEPSVSKPSMESTGVAPS
jgi:hypothetical protein